MEEIKTMVIKSAGLISQQCLHLSRTENNDLSVQ